MLGMSFSEKVKLLKDIDAYARDRDTRTNKSQPRYLHRGKQFKLSDPEDFALLILGLSAFECLSCGGHGSKMKAGDRVGGRLAYDRYIATNNWKQQVDEALRIALVNLEATAAPAGEMDVVLGRMARRYVA